VTPRAVTAIVVAACATVAVVAGATGPIHLPVDVPPDQVHALSGIDDPISGERGNQLIESSLCPEIPGGCIGNEPVDTLIQLARDPDGDPGVRIRAYRALGLYPTANTALSLDLGSMGAAPAGTDQLYLRAVIEALGEIGGPTDVTKITPFLDFEASRDIRAAAADALRTIGCQCDAARNPLHARLQNKQDGTPIETSQQVVLAIQRALRDLTPD
jgi:hypothetical protein